MAVKAPSEIGPPTDTWYKHRVRLLASVREAWRARELVRTLAERDIRARYKQATLGLAWAVLAPLVLMVVFTVVFKRVADVDTDGVPYPLFVYLGLLPWTFFSTAVAGGGMSLVANTPLLNKVPCPREVFPTAQLVVAAVDSFVAVGVLGVLFAIEGFAPHAEALWAPVLLLVLLMFTLGLALLVSAVLVFIRDVRHALPLVLQVGLFVTPVAFGVDALVDSQRGYYLYSLLNPLAPVIDGLRRTVLHGQSPDWTAVGLGALSASLVLMLGYRVFKRLEYAIADVV